MLRLAVVMVLVAALAMRTEGARISLPNPDAGDRDGRHWLDQADDMRGAPGGSAEGSERDHNGPFDGPDPPWWFASYVMLHEGIRQGRRPARYVVWTCSSLLGEAAPGMHSTSAAKDATWRTADIFNAPSHVGPRPSKSARDGDYLGCAGYGNRLYGIGTSLLYALVTGKLTPHACSSERLSVYAFVIACAWLCRFYVYNFDHKILPHSLGCRSRLDDVPSKTCMRICICTLTPPPISHPTPALPTNRQGATHRLARAHRGGAGGDAQIGAARPT
jgi:hypothetical protein